ncbi:MAG: hypothetical protein M5U25_21060 [Planctomycetota bacterium]|nr:hypothetical protein [Planctomycetota bacterium]
MNPEWWKTQNVKELRIYDEHIAEEEKDSPWMFPAEHGNVVINGYPLGHVVEYVDKPIKVYGNVIAEENIPAGSIVTIYVDHKGNGYAKLAEDGEFF